MSDALKLIFPAPNAVAGSPTSHRNIRPPSHTFQPFANVSKTNTARTRFRNLRQNVHFTRLDRVDIWTPRHPLWSTLLCGSPDRAVTDGHHHRNLNPINKHKPLHTDLSPLRDVLNVFPMRHEKAMSNTISKIQQMLDAAEKSTKKANMHQSQSNEKMIWKSFIYH
jgi:hypothetical protein